MILQVTAHSYERASKTFGDKLAGNEQIFKNVFELGRRGKIQNPSCMRATYGKMMW